MMRMWWYRQLHVILPVAYALVWLFLVFVLGGAGHGPGIELAWKLSMPASLLLKGGFGAELLLGSAQYMLLGVLIQGAVLVNFAARWRKRKAIE